ncbi:MAG TPA: DMT family transporter, partial [Gemmatales bacterium]|nr:DMT family transporter [Gemmatales bacterium]
MDAAIYPMLGKLAALAASLIWSCSISLYRYHGAGVPAQTLNLYKLLVALVGFSAITLILQGLHLLGWVGEAPHFPQSWEKSGWLMLSGLIGLTLGDTLFFFSIRYLGAALTAAIQCLTPPLNALIDWMVLKVPMTSIQ